MCCITVNAAEYVKWAESQILEAEKRVAAARFEYKAIRAEYKAIRAEYDAKSWLYRFFHTRPGDEFCSYLLWDLKDKHNTFCTVETERYLPAARYAVNTGAEFQIPNTHDFLRYV